MPLATQAKLLQFLSSGAFYPIGCTDLHHADVHLITATNIDLDAAVAAGDFKQDLLYRIKAYPILVPSLRDRTGDLPEMIRLFVAAACDRFRLDEPRLTNEAKQRLVNHPYAGNIRELQNLLEAARARCLGDGDDHLQEHHLALAPAVDPDPVRHMQIATADFRTATCEFQRSLLHAHLIRAGWNVSRTATNLQL
jgi:transcriptional regulator with GAF, ATPase, and Fis domain